MNYPIVYHPDYIAPMPLGHRFPMAKFKLLRDLLLDLGIATPEQFQQPELPPVAWLESVHTAEYVRAYLNGTLDSKAQRRIGLPWSPALANRTRIAVGGTVLTARLALEYGLACNTAGGTHHAFPDFGSGYCIFNDLAVAARVLQRERLVKKVLIVDLDVHQGDGTALIFADDEAVFTWSLHCGKNFPFRKQRSDLDVALPVGVENRAYLDVVAHHLPTLLRAYQPDLVLYDAGADVHRDDRLGKLKLTDEGVFYRDYYVLQVCLELNYPVAAVIGGGYDQDLEALALRHSLLHQAAAALLG